MNPKFLLGALILSGGLFHVADIGRCADGASTVKVMIDIPEYGWEGKISRPRTLENRLPNDEHFFVVLENVSSKPVVVSETSGVIEGLSFEITIEDGKIIVLHRVHPEMGKAVTTEVVVVPGQATVVEVFYGRGGNWEPFPFPQKRGQPRKVKMRAIFEGAGGTGLRSDFFRGTAVSESYEVTLLNGYEPQLPQSKVNKVK